MQYVKTTAIIGAVIVGEPNNSKETAVHLYAKDLSEQYIGHLNDTYNKYDGANSYFSYKNCGIICEWGSNPFDNSSDGYFIKLSNGLLAKLGKDPTLGDYTVDTDGDGLCDLEELNTVINISVFNPYNGLGAESNKTISAWSFTSNPAKADTDGDGIKDSLDQNPLKTNIYEYGAIIYNNIIYPIEVPDCRKTYIEGTDWVTEFDKGDFDITKTPFELILGALSGISFDDNSDLKSKGVYAGPVLLNNLRKTNY